IPGYVGGGWYNHKGAGTNSLCLPETPEYDKDLITNAVDWRSLIYGAEFGGNLQNYDLVCAVCLVRGRSTTLMIPAKLTCPSGWTKEYGGLLMGSYKNYNAHDYICVDKNTQGRPGSAADKNGAIFQPTQGKCGSLPCPPYVDGNELACVVCSR
ncbi:short-chain collagen C4-like, partial [Anneissia japonica]|uniref:short-chain collagen C4-like n=1 Tax=Anneissia japonica TaxID=1529436 RepID=UPI0014258024